MAFLVHSLPPTPVWVRMEYLYDHKRGHGRLTPGMLVSVRSIPGKALYFEVLLLEYGSLFDKIPISGFVSTPTYNRSSSRDLPLSSLQLWDCFSRDITVIEKPLLGRCNFVDKHDPKVFHPGTYLYTIDSCHAEPSLDLGFSELDQEHKTFNILRLDNGQFAAQPNNRMAWSDPSLIPRATLTPDFSVCSQNYTVELDAEPWSVGHTTDWSYKPAG